MILKDRSVFLQTTVGMKEMAPMWGCNDLVLVTSLLLRVLAFLEWSPKRLIHLFSLRAPLTWTTCVSPGVCTS